MKMSENLPTLLMKECQSSQISHALQLLFSVIEWQTGCQLQFNGRVFVCLDVCAVCDPRLKLALIARSIAIAAAQQQ
jgi:hypothetical protein